MIFISLYFCFSIFLIKKLNNLYQKKDINLILSNIHAFITFFNSFFYLTKIIDINLYINISSISILYACYDIYLLNLINDNNFKNMLIHHSILIIGNIWINLTKNDFVTNIVAYNYLTEISTPFLNLSLYLYQNKKTHIYKKTFKISNILLLITFFLFRILLGMYLVKITLFYNNYSFLQIILWFLNLYWFSKLLKKSIEFVIN